MAHARQRGGCDGSEWEEEAVCKEKRQCARRKRQCARRRAAANTKLTSGTITLVTFQISMNVSLNIH